MGSKERRERERDEKSEQIINTAREIISQEGLENLTIRKIANKMEYSPAIIYHYFKDKDDLVNHLMKEGYQKIVQAISSAMRLESTPEEKLKNMTRSYIEAALQIPDEFLQIQLNKSAEILQFTASLFPGAAQSKPALKILVLSLKEIYRDKQVAEDTLELTAQIVASATLGLIIKLILEKNISDEQKERLIDHFTKCIVEAMIMGKPLMD